VLRSVIRGCRTCYDHMDEKHFSVGPQLKGWFKGLALELPLPLNPQLQHTEALKHTHTPHMSSPPSDMDVWLGTLATTPTLRGYHTTRPNPQRSDIYFPFVQPLFGPLF